MFWMVAFSSYHTVTAALQCGLRSTHTLHMYICINILVPICLVPTVRHWSATVSASEEGNVYLPGEYMSKHMYI